MKILVTYLSKTGNIKRIAEEIREATKEVAKNTKLIGIFSCQGELATWIKTVMRMMIGTSLSTYAKEDNSHGQPNKERVEKARIFAIEIINKIK